MVTKGNMRLKSSKKMAAGKGWSAAVYLIFDYNTKLSDDESSAKKDVREITCQRLPNLS